MRTFAAIRGTVECANGSGPYVLAEDHRRALKDLARAKADLTRSERDNYNLANMLTNAERDLADARAEVARLQGTLDTLALPKPVYDSIIGSTIQTMIQYDIPIYGMKPAAIMEMQKQYFMLGGRRPITAESLREVFERRDECSKAPASSVEQS